MGLRFRKKKSGRESLTENEKTLLGQYTKVSKSRDVRFKRSPPPEPRPVTVLVEPEAPQPAHYWYDETEHPVTGKSEASEDVSPRIRDR